MSRGGATALVVLAVGPARGATIAGYARLAFFNSGQFADRASAALAEPAVRNSMSAPLPGWYSAEQERPIGGQLEDGIRGLLLDTHYGDRLASGRVRTYAATLGPEPLPTLRSMAEPLLERFRPDPVLVDGLWLDRVLDSGRGHPVMLAAVATEAARRAGWSAIRSSREAWFTGLVENGVLWLVDPTGAASGSSAPKTVRRHCAHEVAFIVLTGLAERFAGPRDREQAHRLRTRLDVSAP
jgi:hypothetical protein